MKKEICMLAPVHQYNDVRVFQKEAKTLSNSGYRVHIIAKCSKVCNIENVSFSCVPKYCNRLQRFLLQPWYIYKTIRLNSDIYHIHNPDTLIVGFFLKLLGKKVIYDTHEDFSKRILMRKWIPKFSRWFIALIIIFLEKMAGKLFNKCIATQQSVANRMGIKTILIENAPIVKGELIDRAYQISAKIEKEKSVTRLIYVGGISENRGILQTVNVLQQINASSNVRMWLIGPSIEDNILDRAKELPGWKYVDYLGPLSQEEAYAYMIKSDIGLVTILDVGDHSNTSPNKLYEYQAFHLPFVASNFKSWEEKLSNCNSGLFVDPLDIRAIKKSIMWLIENKDLAKEMGKNGHNYVTKTYNWEIESQKLLKLYNDL